MKCDRCGKLATIHLSETRKGELVSRHLCEGCAGGASADMRDAASLVITKPAGIDPPKCERCGAVASIHVSAGRRGAGEIHWCEQCAQSMPEYVETQRQIRTYMTKLMSRTHLLVAEGETLVAAVEEFEQQSGRAPNGEELNAIRNAAERFVATMGRIATAGEIVELLRAIIPGRE